MSSSKHFTFTEIYSLSVNFSISDLFPISEEFTPIYVPPPLSDDTGLGIGAIIGIILGALALTALAAALIYFCYCRKKPLPVYANDANDTLVSDASILSRYSTPALSSSSSLSLYFVVDLSEHCNKDIFISQTFSDFNELDSCSSTLKSAKNSQDVFFSQTGSDHEF